MSTDNYATGETTTGKAKTLSTSGETTTRNAETTTISDETTTGDDTARVNANADASMGVDLASGADQTAIAIILPEDSELADAYIKQNADLISLETQLTDAQDIIADRSAELKKLHEDFDAFKATSGEQVSSLIDDCNKNYDNTNELSGKFVVLRSQLEATELELKRTHQYLEAEKAAGLRAREVIKRKAGFQRKYSELCIRLVERRYPVPQPLEGGIKTRRELTTRLDPDVLPEMGTDTLEERENKA